MRTLLLGDSHAAGPPGQALWNLLGAKGRRVGEVGWGTRTWDGQGTAELLRHFREVQPTRVIYMFGTNDVPGAAVVGAMRNLKETALRSDAFDIWFVGPPSYPDSYRDQISYKLNTAARMVFGPKHIDSQRMTSRSTIGRTPDGIHFRPSGAKVWATGVARIINGGGLVPLTFGVAMALWAWLRGNK